MSTPAIRYSQEFKANIVRLFNEEHRSMMSLQNEYGVSIASIAKWVKQAKPIELDDGTTISQTEFKALKKENEKLKAQLSILKAAAVLLGQR